MRRSCTRTRTCAGRPIAGFRNVLVHGYLQVDLSVVEEILKTKLDELEEFARRVEAYLARA